MNEHAGKQHRKWYPVRDITHRIENLRILREEGLKSVDKVVLADLLDTNKKHHGPPDE